jgi:hypothetical protein
VLFSAIGQAHATLFTALFPGRSTGCDLHPS